MSVATPAASRLLCRSLAADSAHTSRTTPSRPSLPPPSPCRPHQQQQRHPFHTSPPALSRRGRRSPYRNVSALKMGLLDPARAPGVLARYKALMTPDYDDTAAAALARRYTPAQRAALRLGERAVAAEDLVAQGRMRNDPYRPGYLDDFAARRPVLDRRARAAAPVDTGARFMTPDEFGDDFLAWIRELDAKAGVRRELFDMRQALAMFQEMRAKALAKAAAGGSLAVGEAGAAVDKVLGLVTGDEKSDEDQGDPDAVQRARLACKDELVQTSTNDTYEIYKYLTQRNSMTGFDGGNSALAPELPHKVPGVAGLYRQEENEEDGTLDPEGMFQEVRRQTGMSTEQIVQIFRSQCKILVRRYVSNQTRLGKIRSTSILCIAGNKDGRLGLGQAKSVDPDVAVAKAKLAAMTNMQPIRRYEQRTIYGNVQGKFGGTVVQLFTRPPGFGLRVPHRFFEMARAAGISDLAAKMPRARNPMNSVKACFHALMNQPDPELIALGRGKKLVDARKVYYGGATL